MTAAKQPASSEIDDVYAELAKLIKDHRESDFIGDYVIISQSPVCSEEYYLLMSIADNGGRLIIPAEKVETLINFPDKLDIAGVSSLFRGTYKNDAPHQMMGLLQRALALQGGVKQKAPKLPKPDIAKDYDDLRKALIKIKNNSQSGMGFVNLNLRQFYQGFHADYVALRLIISGSQGKDDLSQKDVQYLLSLPERINNSPVLSAKIGTSQFLKDYNATIIPILEKLERALTTYTAEEQEAAQALQKFWQRRGPLLQKIYDNQSMPKVRNPLWIALKAAKQLQKGNDYNANPNWSSWVEYEPDLLKLRAAFAEVSNRSVDVNTTYGALHAFADLLDQAKAPLFGYSYYNDMKDAMTEYAQVRLKLEAARRSAGKQLGAGAARTP